MKINLIASLCVFAAGSAAFAIDVPGLRYVDRYSLPYSTGLAGTTFGNTLFGGISGLDYDAVTDSYYAISDDRSQNAPAGGNPAARFYNISIGVNQNGFNPSPITINNVTQLRDVGGGTFPALGVDPEAIRFRRNGSDMSIVWTSEGAVSATSNPPLQNPFVREANLNGDFVREFSNPNKFNPDAVAGQTRGIRNNVAFESLTLSTDGTRTYTATESSLFQDGPRSTATTGSTNRILELDTATGNPLREFVYVADPIVTVNPANANDSGLVELLAIGDNTFLAVERSFSRNEGNNVRVYKISLTGATDVSGMDSLVGQTYAPVTKELLINLAAPAFGGEFNPDNIEALSLGPVLPNGDQSFFLVSDNNFSTGQSTQFIMLAVPAPASGLLALAGLAGATRRRR